MSSVVIRCLLVLSLCTALGCSSDSSNGSDSSDGGADETIDVAVQDERHDQTADRGQDNQTVDRGLDERSQDEESVDDTGDDSEVDSADDSQTGAPQTRVYVILSSHNEDTATGANPACLELFENLDTRWAPNRQALIDIVNLVEEKDAVFSLQTDVEFLNILVEREAADDNFIRDLLARPAGRFGIDAHVHESPGKNLADVANLVEQVTGVRNGVVGGFAAVTCSGTGASLDWEKYREPLRPRQGGDSFVATLLAGGVSAGHRCEPNTLGIWRPASNVDYFTDDPDQDLPTIGSLGAGGGLEQSLEDVERLVDDMRSGRLEPESMYPFPIIIPHCEFDLEDGRASVADVAVFVDGVNALDNGSGDIQWATFAQLNEIWETEYHSNPSMWVFDDE